MYEALDIAKRIINIYYNSYGSALSITKLHKLLYIVYGTYLVVGKTYLFKEEPLCLPYGPVFETVHKAYDNSNLDLCDYHSEIIVNETMIDKDMIDETIEDALSQFGEYSAKALSNWTHRRGSAWDKTYRESKVWGAKIDELYIKKEFEKLING